MKKQPTFKTQRLVLRPFNLSDAKTVQKLAGDDAIADTTINIPHPYRVEMAEEWISTHPAKFEEGEMAIFAIVAHDSRNLLGAIGLIIESKFDRAELGYWIGKPYWNKGYCTEAGRTVLAYAFWDLGLHRVYAHHFSRNPASGRVLKKLGMIHEGRARHHAKKEDQFEDLELYGILETDWPQYQDKISK